jgi:hypothetical protein
MGQPGVVLLPQISFWVFHSHPDLPRQANNSPPTSDLILRFTKRHQEQNAAEAALRVALQHFLLDPVSLRWGNSSTTRWEGKNA